MALIRKLTDLTIYRDDAGAPWWALAEVTQMLRQPSTRHVSRTFKRGACRRTTPKSLDWRFRRVIFLIDGPALLEACLALGMMPHAEARAYVRAQELCTA
jgi:hypothetical protein